MTDFRIKIAIIAVATFAATFAGCKKDESSYTFTLESSSLDFEYGQTKELAFSSNKISNPRPTTIPTGWKCTYNNGKFRITAPAGIVDPSTEQSGTITFSAENDSNITVTRNVTVAVRTAIEITRAANCFVVSEPGKRYKFAVGMRGSGNVGSIDAAAKAFRVWSTSKTAVVNVSYEYGYVYFATGEGETLQEANAVIAVADKDNNVLWSWHIWAVADDPAANPDRLGGMDVMSRNLGAFTNSNASADDAVRSYGLYYQWGRKDPFVGPVKWDSTTPVTIYSASNSATTHAYTTSNAETGTVAYAVANPNAFIAGHADSGFDWLYYNTGLSRLSVSPIDYSRWSPISKTLYDPCPAGWRVAPANVWSGFTRTGMSTVEPTEFNVEGEYKYGWTFAVDNGAEVNATRVFFPAAGRRNYSPSLAVSTKNYTNVVNDSEGKGYLVGFYWSSNYPLAYIESPQGSALAFRHDYVNPGKTSADTPESALAGGFPLRCVADLPRL